MSRLSPSTAAVLLTFFMAMSGCDRGGDVPVAKTNFVFILADDLGWGDIGAYGHPYAETSHLDRLAEDGTLFHRFYASGAVCVPSRAGFMTSRSIATFVEYPRNAGFQGRLTLTELLEKNGYATGHFGKWHMGSLRKNGTYGIDKISGGPKSNGEEGRDAGLFDAAIAFIERNREVPFYVNVWTRTAHFPVDPHPSLAAVFKDVQVKREDFPKHMQSKFEEVERIGSDLNEGMANYLGELYSMDLLVGKLVAKLDELGLRENTVVVFSSDQGPAPVAAAKSHISGNMLGSAGGLRGGKFTYWEGGVRVPFIVRWPGNVPAGKVNATSIMSGLDWLPTVATIAGIAYEKSMFEGEDVSDIWEGADRSRENPLFWTPRANRSRLTMLQGDWKLHMTSGEAVLYNLAEDPEEDFDVASEYPMVFEALEKKLTGWSESLDTRDDSKAVVIGPADLP